MTYAAKTNKGLKGFLNFFVLVMVVIITWNVATYFATKDVVDRPVPTTTATAPAEEASQDVMEMPYDRAWFESRSANAFKVMDDNGLTCAKTIRYQLLKEQSTKFIFENDCSGIKEANVQDFYSGEWYSVTGTGAEWHTEHVVPFSMLFDKFGRYIQFDGDQQLGIQLYYDRDNLVASLAKINAEKSDKVGYEVSEKICDDALVYGCSIWTNPYSSGTEYINKSVKFWEKWEAIMAGR